MNNKTHKYLDDLSKEVIKSTPIEQPILDFTSTVMTQVLELKTSPFTYKPLISKKGWFIVFAFVVSSIILVTYTSDSLYSSLLVNSIDFNVLFDNTFLEALCNMSVSKTVIYAVVLFGVMFSVQISMLKYYFNKRFKI
ncbi:hypothetical protein MHTCC0001_19340 [Flavobacteriaceae bacterium MHTCC 0001]